MMKKTKSNPARISAATLLLPVIIGAAALTSTPEVAAVINGIKTVDYSAPEESKLEVVAHAQDAEGASIAVSGKSDQSLEPVQVQVIAYGKDNNSEPKAQPKPANSANSAKAAASKPAQPAQQQKKATDVVDQPEVLPQYKDGEVGIYRALALNMKYPKESIDAQEQGRVVVEFIVNTDGTASDFKVERTSGFEALDNEAIRVCKEVLSTGWTPGKDHGKTVRCSYVLPVMFRLQ